MTAAVVAILLTTFRGSPTPDAQRLSPSARELLNSDRPLLPAELPVVLEGVRTAAAGKTFRLAFVAGGSGFDILMGPNGRPRFVRTTSAYDMFVVAGSASSRSDGSSAQSQKQQGGHVDLITLTEYTGQRARECDGSVRDGELVIVYEHRSTDDQWTASAHARGAIEPLSPVFDMLDGTIAAQAGALRDMNGRTARALAAPWALHAGARPAGPLPAGMTQSLWIDTTSMLPLRWSVEAPATTGRWMPTIPDYGLFFTADPRLDLHRPDGLSPPDCVH